MTDQLDQLRERIAAMEAEMLVAWRRHSGVTQAAREVFQTFESAASNAKKAANGAARRVELLRDDDTLPVESRQRQVREAITAAQAEVQKQLSRMGAAAEVLKAEVALAAAPRLDKSREMAARDELRLLLDNSRDPAAVLMELAQRDDELAAVAVSSYGESYLRARAVPDAKILAQKVREVAAASATHSADPERRKAGEARADFANLDRALALTTDITRTTLESAGGGL